MRGVILAGGYGTRMRPATFVTNKHLCPLYSKEQGAIPMIYFPINTLVNSGVEDILIISSRRHCGPIIENLAAGHDFNAKFTYKVQDITHVPLGIASALKLAKDFTQDDPFAVILGDNFYEDSFKDEFKRFSVLVQELNRKCCASAVPFCPIASIFLKQVPDPERFGVATINGDTVSIDEKPKEPKSNWAVTGLYLYTAHVYKVTKQFDVSDRGELEITDINNHYCKTGGMTVNYLDGFWSDIGIPESMIRTQQFIQESGFVTKYGND
jgi:glucose-1-phosphate thymidylyltransferase